MTQPASKYDYSNPAPPRVSAALGYTVNLGDFESLRIDFSIEDVKRPGETLEEGTERVFGVVNDILEGKVAAAKRTFRGK